MSNQLITKFCGYTVEEIRNLEKRTISLEMENTMLKCDAKIMRKRLELAVSRYIGTCILEDYYDAIREMER